MREQIQRVTIGMAAADARALLGRPTSEWRTIRTGQTNLMYREAGTVYLLSINNGSVTDIQQGPESD